MRSQTKKKATQLKISAFFKVGYVSSGGHEASVVGQASRDAVVSPLPPDVIPPTPRSSDRLLTFAGTRRRRTRQAMDDDVQLLLPAKVRHQEEMPVQCERHTVLGVEGRCDGRLVLRLWSEPLSRERRCVLEGFWAETEVLEGDVVNVLSDFDDDDCVTVGDDAAGLLVVDPDLLMSCTAVVAMLFCPRKALLSEWFRDRDNVHLFLGRIVHQLFQDVLMRRRPSSLDDVEGRLRSILHRSENLVHMYRFRDKHSEDSVWAELVPFVEQTMAWLNKYVTKEPGTSDLRVTKVLDIEENIWSPRLGLKGKIDATVEVEEQRRNGCTAVTRRVVPLELKTGRASFSSEHVGQVALYGLLSGERPGRDPGWGGLLLYLRDGDMRRVGDDGRCHRGLMQLRNEMARQLRHPVRPQTDEGVVPGLAPLPTPISNERACRRCPHLTTCALYARLDGGGVEGSNSFTTRLVPEATAHLERSDVDYFARWCSLLFLERAACVSYSDVWRIPAAQRERRGECLGDLVLAPAASDNDNMLHRFTRNGRPMSAVALNSVVVSVGQLVAVASGQVVAYGAGHVDVLLDRDLHGKWNDASFRIDAVPSTSTFATSLSNVARLMSPDERYNRLRRVVVDRLPATFRDKIGRDPVVAGRRRLKALNSQQKAAVLRVLMTDDYALIKGMPGAGKTATIVALVGVLHDLGRSVLLASHTHAAVDNILVKLRGEGLDFVRVGPANRVHPALRDRCVEHMLDGVTSLSGLTSLLASKRIVATTCLGVGHSLLSRRFDYCVVDEASQVLQAACLGPLFLADRFVLVGDPRQLPPLVRSSQARSLGMDESLLDRLDSPSSTVQLNVQYRMNKEIMRLANELSYGGALQCASDEVANAVLRLPCPSDAPEWFGAVASLDPRRAVLFLDTDGAPALEGHDANGRLVNEGEAQVVADVAYFLLEAGLAPRELGVISPFRNQVACLRRRIAVEDVEVNTVDQFQGRDKEAIVVSFVRSADAPPPAHEDILDDMRRVNVAITRARKKLVMVGSRSTLRHYEPLGRMLAILAPCQIIALPPA